MTTPADCIFLLHALLTKSGHFSSTLTTKQTAELRPCIKLGMSKQVDYSYTIQTASHLAPWHSFWWVHKTCLQAYWTLSVNELTSLWHDFVTPRESVVKLNQAGIASASWRLYLTNFPNCCRRTDCLDDIIWPKLIRLGLLKNLPQPLGTVASESWVLDCRVGCGLRNGPPYK